MEFVDTHCHLNVNSFTEDLNLVFQRAQENRVNQMLVPGTTLETSVEAVQLSEQHANVYAAVGVHPNDALTWTASTLAGLEELARSTQVVAIGEIGLDFYRQYAPAPVQMQVLAAQLDLAEKLDLPVIIHTRQSLAEIWPIMQTWHDHLVHTHHPLADRPGVFHSYEGDLSTAIEITQRNFFIGISGPVTYKNASLKQQVTAALPITAILTETDAPYLPPHPFRGQRNEPAYIPLIAQKIADLLVLPLEIVSQNTVANAERLFRWRAIV
ncbi:MAG: TatD family hydrolase [Chloroflexi bacterium]|nr:TatD family hydrolase [Chloroflexota bacterium]